MTDDQASELQAALERLAEAPGWRGKVIVLPRRKPRPESAT